ncbi:MAG: hypothetical protein ACI9N1_002018 [Flavobacteriales bacterium]|jgi:uncharacterized protein YukE
MKTLKPLSILLFISILLINCSENKEEQTSKDDKTTETVDSENLVLNNGKKWAMDVKMMVNVKNMEQIVTDFSGTTGSEYKQLSILLDSNINNLISSCTMEGKAHDQLHTWLMPFVQNVESLGLLENDQAKHLENIKASFTIFNTYFK